MVRLAPAVLVAATLCCFAGPAAAEERERAEIVLEVAKLPAADRARLEDRARSIADARASGVPLWRSFEPREVLQETLREIAANGADLGEGAIVNFDTLEVDVPSARRRELEALPFVRSVRPPVLATPSGAFDGEGAAAIGADLANLAGVTGAGVKVAILDPDWKSLQNAVTAGELPAIPLTAKFKINRNAATAPINQEINDTGDREHGTAAAEVVHEIAPGATLLLLRIEYLNAAGISAAAIEQAIRHATDQGANVILIPLHFLSTMSDPRGIAQGGSNPFTDDVAYATAAGATVVVAAGNEASRHWQEQFTPCTGCTKDDLCNTAPNDTAYHQFDGDLPLNDLTFDPDYEDYALGDGGASSYRPVSIVCYSATDSADPSKFRFELFRFSETFGDDPDPPDYPSCPSDAGSSVVRSVPLGQSFSVKSLTLFGENFDDFYFLAVRRISGTERPNFRVNCTLAAEEMFYFDEVGSLSDLAVIADTISVGATAAPTFDTVTDGSSWGPTADLLGPVKPDLVAPGEVTSFAVHDFGFVLSQTFNGTSAAAAHVAGVVALLQSYLSLNGMPPFTPAQVKQSLIASALELDDGLAELAGPDPLYGHGLVQVPAAILPGATPDATRDDWDGDAKADPAHFAAASGNWAWLGSSAGQESLIGFGAGLTAVPGDYDGDGVTDAAVYDASTGSWQFSGSSEEIAQVVGLGGPGLVPVPGDWDGDGTTDPAVYDPATGDWTYQRSSDDRPGQVDGFGGAGLTPIPGDWDGDGRFDAATFAGATGQWAYLGTTSGLVQFQFGGGGGRFTPVPADYDGDRRMDAALYQKKKGKWRLRLSSLGGVAQSFTGFGGAGFAAVPADFDGDGKADPAVYRKSNGNWRYRGSGSGELVTIGAFGGAGVQPVVGMRP
jgi:hypothetical protein